MKISDEEVGLKNKSYFKTSYGDEAGCAAKKGVITSQNKGKVYFQAWSSDVKFEGQNAVRHFDITTNNHASVPGDTPVWPYLDEAAIASGTCAKDVAEEKAACQDFKPHGSKDACAQSRLGKGKPSQEKTSAEANTLADRTAADECLAKRRCALQPYKSEKASCCPQQTGHHLIEASALHETGRGGPGSVTMAGMKAHGEKNCYSENMAPCVCAEGTNQHVGTHGLMHAYQSASAASCRSGDIKLSNGETMTAKKTTYKTAKGKAIDAMEKTFPDTKCERACIEAQLDAYHNQCGITDKTTIKAVEEGSITESAADQLVKERAQRVANMRGSTGFGSG